MSNTLTMALPKGRLMKKTQSLFTKMGMEFSFEDRKLVAKTPDESIKFFLVKNSDLPTYVHHGIAGLGICGSDVLYEAGHEFCRLHTFDYGGTTMSLAGMADQTPQTTPRVMKVATKFTKFTRDYYNSRGIPVEIIKLNGSVELAPVLGLAPHIVDLVETGSTLKANNLKVYQELADIKVHLIANPAYYKIHYEAINPLVEALKKADMEN